MYGFYLLDYPNPYTPQTGYPRRGSSLSGTCIIHTAENAMDLSGPDDSAESVANFIRTRSDYGSYHTLVDSDSIIEMAPYEYETWQDSMTNPWAVGLSCAVQANSWHLIPIGRREAIYRNLAIAAADFVKYMKSKGITVPLRRISGAEARARVPGFCAHGDSGVDRSDPGLGFEWAKFFQYTKEALGLTPSTPVTPKEVREVKAYKHIQVDQPGTARNLGKDVAWYLKDKGGKLNQNFAVGGPGYYDIDLFLQGYGLGADQQLTVNFFLVKGQDRSGYYTQEIHGSADGRFQGHIRFKRPIPSGYLLEASISSSAAGSSLSIFGAEIYVF